MISTQMHEIRQQAKNSAKTGLCGYGKTPGAIAAISGHDKLGMELNDAPLEEIATTPFEEICDRDIGELFEATMLDDALAEKVAHIICSRRNEFAAFINMPRWFPQDWARTVTLLVSALWIPACAFLSRWADAYEMAHTSQELLLHQRFRTTQGLGSDSKSIFGEDSGKFEMRYLMFSPIYMSLSLMDGHPEECVTSILNTASRIYPVSPCTLWRMSELAIVSGTQDLRLIHRAIPILNDRNQVDAAQRCENYLRLHNEAGRIVQVERSASDSEAQYASARTLPPVRA